jgi:DNA topoisomerase-1
MRTDSTHLSEDAVTACRAYIADSYGSEYLPESPNVYTSKEGAQEAHEAIRPSNVGLPPVALADVEHDALRLYGIIWQQFVACQMQAARYTSTKVEVQAGEYQLRAAASSCSTASPASCRRSRAPRKARRTPSSPTSRSATN